jgi:hypothetical protein
MRRYGQYGRVLSIVAVAGLAACGSSSDGADDGGPVSPGGSSSSGSVTGSSGGVSGSSSGGVSGSSSGGVSGSSSGSPSGSSSGSSSGGLANDAGLPSADASVPRDASTGPDATTGPRDAGGEAATRDAGRVDSGAVDGGPVFTGPTTNGTVTVNRATRMGQLAPGFAGFSFEKSHMTDGWFTGTNAPLIALFKLLGPGFVRIGADDVDSTTWVPGALPVAGGQTSTNIGTVDVDGLAAFLSAAGWKTIYGVSMRSAIAPSVAESVYASAKLGSSLHSLEIGNEINFFANNAVGTPMMQWESFQVAVAAATPGIPLAAPAAAGAIPSFTVPFVNAEAKKIVLVTEHYYKGAASSMPTVAQILAIDPSVVTQSQQLAAAAQANNIPDGYRWGEMNSYSGHGAQGVSDVFASALWGIDFMLTTAQYGAAGVNFHGGGQNMDGNVCTNGVASCTKPFRYSPIDEVNSQVTAAAPLYYGMLLVSRAGTGNMLATTAAAGALNFSGYTISQADGSTNVVLVNKDATNGVNATVDIGAAVTEADGTYLQAPSLTSTTGVTFAGAGVTPAGSWNPNPPFALTATGNSVRVLVPPASAVIVHAH